MKPHGIDTGKFERTSLFYRRRIAPACSWRRVSTTVDHP